MAVNFMLKPDFHFEVNDKVGKPLKYLKGDAGLYRFGQLMDRVPFLIGRLVEDHKEIDEFSRKNRSAWQHSFTIPRAITMTPESCENIGKGLSAIVDRNASGMEKLHAGLETIVETTDLVSMYILSGLTFLPFLPVSKKLADQLSETVNGATLVHDVTDVAVNYDKWRILGKTTVLDLDKEAVEQTRTNHLLALAKGVVSAVGGVFWAIGMVTGRAYLPLVMAAIFSLSATVFAIAKDLHKDVWMQYKPINAYRDVVLATV
jgi:hypothetical protein